MKKLLTILLCLLTVLSLSACGSTQEEEPATVEEEKQEEVAYDYSAKSEGVMTYAEYAAAEKGAEVTIEAYVQAVQSYWGGAKLYLADPDGAYFVYQNGDIAANISEEDYAKLGVGTTYENGWMGLANGQKVVVTGVKDEWSGEVEITGTATVPSTVKVIEEGVCYKAPLTEISLVGNGVEEHINQYVSIKGLTVTAETLYNWDGSGSEGDDLYYTVTTEDGGEFQFVVESYLCYAGSQPYETAKSLAVGDVIDVEGFLYWYNAPQLHTTSIIVNGK